MTRLSRVTLRLDALAACCVGVIFTFNFLAAYVDTVSDGFLGFLALNTILQWMTVLALLYACTDRKAISRLKYSKLRIKLSSTTYLTWRDTLP